jgi:hypothetical protein
LDGLQLAERQLQDLDDAMSRGGSSSSEGVATAVKVLLRLGAVWMWGLGCGF